MITNGKKEEEATIKWLNNEKKNLKYKIATVINLITIINIVITYQYLLIMIVIIIVYELIITVTNTVIISVAVIIIIIIDIQSDIWQKTNGEWFGMGTW